MVHHLHLKSGVFSAGFIPVTWWEKPQKMGGFHQGKKKPTTKNWRFSPRKEENNKKWEVFHQEFLGRSRFKREKELVKQQ